jgi:hypothetical protein
MRNARPSNIKNIGDDIQGAARHNNDTYDNPAREKQKREKKERNELKAQAAIEIKVSSNPLSVIEAFELNSYCQRFELANASNIAELKAIVLTKKESERFKEMAKDFNRMSRRVWKAKHMSEDQQRAYFDKKTKETFHENNGLKKPWATSLDSFSVETLSPMVRALQFGNSVTDNERIYCASNLKESLDLIAKHFDIETSKLGFAFGSRGKAGSVAHYQPSLKTLAFNRGWIGALAHELGHAIDHELGNISLSMPYNIKANYLQKIKDNPDRKYYAKNCEIFARMFEMYCFEKLGIRNEFFLSIFDMSVMPEMSPEIVVWLENVLSPIIRKAN